MRKVYGAFSSIIRWILPLPRGRMCTDNIYSKHPMASEVGEAYRLDISKEYRTEDFLRPHLTFFLSFRDLTKSFRCRWTTASVSILPKSRLNVSRCPSRSFFIILLSILLACDSEIGHSRRLEPETLPAKMIFGHIPEVKVHVYGQISG